MNQNDIEKAIEIYKDNIWHMEQNPDAFESDLPRFKLVLQALEKQLQSQWIPVTERLPENQQRVIVQRKKCPMVMGWLMFGKWHTDFGRMYRNYEVTHWMPLPEPPKEDNNE